MIFFIFRRNCWRTFTYIHGASSKGSKWTTSDGIIAILRSFLEESLKKIVKEFLEEFLQDSQDFLKDTWRNFYNYFNRKLWRNFRTKSNEDANKSLAELMTETLEYFLKRPCNNF